jgi:lauroyl/myristoyl acyltransferase
VSLSRSLQKHVLGLGRSTERRVLKREVLACTLDWYAQNPAGRETIRANLAVFGLDSSNRALDAVVHHIALHYYEKLIPLYATPQDYAAYLRERVSVGESARRIAETQKSGRASLVAVSHFGAVELITPTLALHGLDISAALRFTTQQLSDAAAQQARAFAESGLFGQVRFIEVGKPGVPAALEMAAVFRRSGILLSVFDERTDYSMQVSLLGRTVWGGAGLDKLITFARAPHRLFAAFMVRTGTETYRLDLEDVPENSPAPIQALFERLQSTVLAHPEQWYFLHEEVPLVEQCHGERAP